MSRSSVRPSLRARTLALAALSLAAVSAMAQSNVTLSGTMDIAAYRGNGYNTAKGTQIGPLSRSNLTFSGNEDLGGGLVATFKLSTRFETDTGSTELTNKPFWHGESTVGIKGGFGHIRVGRAMDAVTANDWAYDPWDNFDRLASPAWSFWHYNYAVDRRSNNGSAEYFRMSNGIFYDSPTYGGFSLSVSGSPEKATAAGAGQSKPLSGALKYADGGFSAMLATGRNGDGDTVKFLGLKQSFGPVAVMGAYDISTYKGTLSNSTAHAATVGATWQLTSVLLQASLGRQSIGDEVNRMASVGARLPLSKRTYIYTNLSHYKPHANDGKLGYGVGLNHSF